MAVPDHEQLKELVDGYVVQMLKDRYGTPVALTRKFPPGTFNPADLPISTPPAGQTNPFIHYVDYIGDYNEAFDWGVFIEQYKEALKTGKWHELPAPFGFKGALPEGTMVQICIYSQPENGYTIIKHVEFPNPIKFSKWTGLLMEPCTVYSTIIPNSCAKCGSIASSSWVNTSVGAFS